MLRDLSGSIVMVVRKTTWLGTVGGHGSTPRGEAEEPDTPQTPRSATRRLV